jgi:uncharacterized protein YegJ (DUF2314 family)
MATTPRQITAIALLLAKPKLLDRETVQRAADFAFHGAPERPTVTAIADKPLFCVALGPLQLGVVNVPQPYFDDAAVIADQISNVAGRMAAIQHKAWLSVDLIGQSPLAADVVLGLIGQLVAEFCDESALGLMRLPKGPIIGYDFSFIPMLRGRKAAQVFSRGNPDRTVRTPACSEALDRATQEARERWPEYVAAFHARRPGEGFGVKKAFRYEGKVEHMWIEVTSIENETIHGRLANEPKHIPSLKMKDPATAQLGEIEDWLYLRGKEQVGAFQAKVLKK